ncbi:MAG TPA: 4Fe-4S binding protein [Geobacterales bacterium]|nr:4Fe-4S binding protein [Geobacterales bacterium]
MLRKIVQIDENKCDGCGLCAPSCAEGAIKIVNGKARLSADNLCDGLGACLGHCPQGAITIIEREGDAFDEAAVEQHLGHKPATPPAAAAHHHHQGGGCPGSRLATFNRTPAPPSSPAAGSEQSTLAQWPVQLHLVPTNAPFLQGADLLITADCVPFAYAGFHRDFLAGRRLVVGCPKLDDNQQYLQKLTEMFRVSGVKSITVLRMEVPCCGGIAMATRQALQASGQNIPLRIVTIGIQGDIKDDQLM